MAWESGKRQVIKFLLMLIGLLAVVVFMLLSFLVIPYSSIEIYLLAQVAVDISVIMLVIFVVNYRVWRYLSGAIFYALEIYNPEGTIDSKLLRRDAYFEVDIDKIEQFMDDRQKKILRENEAAIADLKSAVTKMTHKQQEAEEKTLKKRLKEAEKEQKEREKQEKRDAKLKNLAQKVEETEAEITMTHVPTVIVSEEATSEPETVPADNEKSENDTEVQDHE